MSTTDNTPVIDPAKEREATLTFKLGQEMLDQFYEPGRKPLSLQAIRLYELAVAFATICAEMRDLQKVPLKLVDEGGNSIVPNVHRKAELMIAGRQASVAITQMELALGMALKAAARVG